MHRGPVSTFMNEHFLHFNAGALMDAARAYEQFVDDGGKMMVTLAGAMSTGELGKSLAEMIRRDKVHIISATGANVEEDLFNLVAHNHYKRIPDYRSLTAQQEWELLQQRYNRVTDTCIPEEEAIRLIQNKIVHLWKKAEAQKERYFPHEFFFQLLLSGMLQPHYEIDPAHSWVLAAAKKNIPILVPGWEDSTLGNVYASYVVKGELSAQTVKNGIEYMAWLCNWYKENSQGKGLGFFQIGGGIAGDFPICVVPLLYQDLGWKDVPFWNYFCQISDSTTSFGSYSGAVPNEKITWGKLDLNTPKFIVESDASIVAPLIFAYVLNL